MTRASATATQRAIGRVLVVDDEIDMLDLARMLLEPLGFEVDVATNGLQGLEAARTKTYDVVVTDVTMPKMDGIELGKALRSDPKTRGARIVVHSALNEAWIRSLFSEFDLFLAKPGGSGGLADGVAQVFRARTVVMHK